MSGREAASEFMAWLRYLPDMIAEAEEYGHKITCPDPGTEHGRRLLDTLGVEIEYAPEQD